MKTKETDSNAIDARESEYLYISTSQIPNAGSGLLTAIDIYKDEIIAVFKGEILTNTQAAIRAKANKDQYFISMIDGSILDSNRTFCFAKYANDAKGLSAPAKGVFNNAKIALNQTNKVCLVAMRNIKKGEEIFCAYGSRYWKRYS